MLLPVLGQGIIAQVPSDSAYFGTEMEGSVSAMTIKPIKHSKKLLKQVIERILIDIRQKHNRNKYQIEATFGEDSSTPFSASCIFSAEAGYNLENVKMEEFHYEGPFILTRQDTVSIESLIMAWATINPIRGHKMYFSWNEVKSPQDMLRKTIEGFDGYNITAYCISDDAGSGVYRISFVPEKKRYYGTSIKGTAYFDCSTLRMTQFKGETNLPNYKSHLRYQIDYNVKGKTPVVKQMNIVGTKDDMVIKATIQRIE